MNSQQEEEIISHVIKEVEESGISSIKQIVENSLHTSISIAEQKTLAKKIVKGNPFITESKKGEIIVKKNANYTGETNNEEKDFKLIKFIIAIVVAVLSYLVFQFLLPALK